MARDSFETALGAVLRHEGGYVDHPRDPGGATNMGITRATLAAFRGRPVTKAEVRGLTADEAGRIYRERYWNAVRGDELPAGVDLAVFDAAVNSGPSRAIRWLQGALALARDGRMGPATLAAARMAEPGALIRSFSAARLAFLRGLPTWPEFGRGWRRRVAETEAAALALARPRRAPTSLSIVSQENVDMDRSKPLIASKTLWANLVGFAAVLSSLLGVQIGAEDAGGLAEALAQIVAAASFVASTVFRVVATSRLTASGSS